MDIRTLTLVNLLFLFLYAAVVTINSRIYGEVPGSRWFAWSSFSRGFAWLLLSLSPILPRWLSTVAGDTFLLIGLLLLHRSLSEVMGRGKTAWQLQLGITCTALAGIAYTSLVYGNFRAALLVVSTGLAVQMALTTAMMFSGLHKGVRGAVWFTGGILFLYALAEMTRAVVLLHSPSMLLEISSTLLGLLLLGALLANGGTAFGFLFLSAAHLRRELTRQAEHDALTGLLNRRGLHALAERTLTASHRAGEPFSAVMLDLDGMKVANDTWGHETGDALLCAVAQVLAHTVGRNGAVARLGGDEFLVVLPGVAEGGAYEIAENLRRSIERLRIPNCRPKASFGVASLTGQEWEVAVRMSDQALNRAKSAGRNRTICYA